MLHGVCRTNPDVIKMRNLQPKQLSGIIIHCVIVFQQRKDIKFLNPCMELLKSLSSMKVNYCNNNVCTHVCNLWHLANVILNF